MTGLIEVFKMEPIATNQTNYPILIEVYEVNEDFITFQSFTATGDKLSARQCSNMIYTTIGGRRAYFKHFGRRYFLDECMTIF